MDKWVLNAVGLFRLRIVAAFLGHRRHVAERFCATVLAARSGRPGLVSVSPAGAAADAATFLAGALVLASAGAVADVAALLAAAVIAAEAFFAGVFVRVAVFFAGALAGAWIGAVSALVRLDVPSGGSPADTSDESAEFASNAPSAAAFNMAIALTIPFAIESRSGTVSGQPMTPMYILPMFESTVMFNPPPSVNGPNG